VDTRNALQPGQTRTRSDLFAHRESGVSVDTLGGTLAAFANARRLSVLLIG